MADTSVVDRKHKMIIELIGLWQEFQSEMDDAVAAPQIEDELEERCMRTKTRIAQKKQQAKELLGEQFNSNSAIVKVMLGVPTLDLYTRQSPILISNLRNVWHDAFIALNQLAGTLKLEKSKVPVKSERSFFGKFFGKKAG